MKQTYQITGMTCGNCKATVTNTLQNIKGVTEITVSLEQQEATIEAERKLNIEELQAVIPSKYTVKETIKVSTSKPTTFNPTDEPNKWKQLFPLFLILAYITVAAFMMNRNLWMINEFMLDFMGLFFIVFSFFKMLDLQGFSLTFSMYDPLAKRVPAYAKIYPFIETVLGILFLMRIEITIALITSLVILSVTTFGVAKTLLNKQKIRCACLGTVLQLPMTEATLIENSIMLIMAIYMLTGIII